MAKSRETSSPTTVMEMLPQARMLEQRLAELIVEGRRIVATLRFLDEVADIDAHGPPLELDESHAALDELAESLPLLEVGG